jgi:ABC-type polysaccharide/polyol phosphate transport system ATPase subunit
MPLEPGRIRLRGVSRTFRVLHERNLTLKETLLRRRRTDSTELWAVRGVDLDVPPGEAIGVVGQNGSGKSTLLKLLAGIIPPHGGTIEIGGTVASMLELGAGFHPDFTGRENVYMNASIHGLSEREVNQRFDEIVAFAELEDFVDMPVRTYSSGMQMRLAFAVASHVNPDVLLLDEVLAVGDEAFQRKCFGRIFDFRAGGGTLVFVSHDPVAVERVCDRAILLVSGEMVAEGGTQDVLAAYHRLLAAGSVEAGGPESTEGSVREWGDRQVTITATRLLGPDGPSDRFIGGEPLTIQMDVEAHRPVRTPNFGISISSVDGELCYGTNTRIDALAISELSGRATVSFSIPALPLHEGSFTVQFAVVSWDESQVHHWLDRWLEFDVFPRVTGIGPVNMSGEWSVAPAPAREPSAAVRGSGDE